jgi:hypothetical protein
MSNMVGADIGELRELAAMFSARAAQLKSIEGQLNWRIHSAPWKGHDVSRFIQDWNVGHRAVIRAAAAAMSNAAQEIAANADEQDKASTAGSGVGGGLLAGLSAIQLGTIGKMSPRNLADWILAHIPVPGGEIAGGVGRVDGQVGAGGQASSHASGSFDGSTLSGSADASARYGAWAQGDASYSVGPASAAVHGDIFAGAQVNSSASGTVGPDEVTGQVQADAMVGVAANAAGAVGLGMIAYSGTAQGFAGASASAGAAGHAGRDGVAGSFAGNAFAGAQVSADVTQDFLGVKSTVGASARAGIGADASGDLSLTYDDVHIGFGLGVAVGVGGGLNADIHLSPKEMVHGVGQVASGAGHVADTGTKYIKSHWPF